MTAPELSAISFGSRRVLYTIRRSLRRMKTAAGSVATRRGVGLNEDSR